MARKKRCNLCGAKLKGDVCQECGYNNAAYDYKINSSETYCSHSSSETFYDKEDHQEHSPDSTDSWDYSHIEELLGKDYGPKEDPNLNEAPVTYGLNEERPKQKKKKKRKWLKWLVLIWFLPTIFELIGALVYNVAETGILERVEIEEVVRMEETPADQEKQNEALQELPVSVREDGSYQTELKAGIYMAGLHLPAGIYDAKLISGSGIVEIRNMEANYWESEYLYENSSKKERTMKKLELTAGTQIRIMDDLVLEFVTEESQGYLPELEVEQVLTTVNVADGMVGGEDFEVGTYDVHCVTEENRNGRLLRKFRNYYGEEALEEILFLEGNMEFQNLSISEGDILLTLNCEITLQPAEYDLSGFSVAW